MRKFLTARWQDLIMANYEVDPSLLAGRVPTGTELDLFEGKCFVSLVGFMFLDTRVMGLRIPFHTNFEEINLRFYVKRNTGSELRRGVVFIKEIVPRLAIAAIARHLYGEPYDKARMWNKNDRERVLYGVSKGKDINSIGVTRGDKIGVPAECSREAFIIEHYWGYTKRGEKRTDEYKVEHPIWELCSNRDVKIKFNFEQWYGKEFGFLSRTPPLSVLLADGSEVAVYKGQTIR